jgi:lipopolysaccharide export system protein LptC
MPARGWSAPDAREVELVDDVRAVREATRTDPEIVFTTSHLTVFPDDEVARTSAPVTMVQGASVIRGVGMEADNKTQIYQLLSQVNSTIEKKRR